MTIWVLVVLVNLSVGGQPAYPMVWPGADSAYSLPPTFGREADCWKARKRVLKAPARGFEDWVPVAATCVAVRGGR